MPCSQPKRLILVASACILVAFTHIVARGHASSTNPQTHLFSWCYCLVLGFKQSLSLRKHLSGTKSQWVLGTAHVEAAVSSTNRCPGGEPWSQASRGGVHARLVRCHCPGNLYILLQLVHLYIAGLCDCCLFFYVSTVGP